MLEIGGHLINSEVSDIVNELRDELTGRNLLSTVKNDPDNIMVTCPFHKNGQEKKPSCGINKKTGVFNCFTCHEKGNLADFVGKCFGKDRDFGTIWIADRFLTVKTDERPELELDMARGKLPSKIHTYVPEMVLDQYRYYHQYMFDRKLDRRVISIFDVGYDKETDCITFPYRDATGQAVLVARRSVRGKWYHYPSGMKKPLYGAYEVSQHYPKTDTIYVCESQINCLTLWTHNIPAVALGGTGNIDVYRQLFSLPCRSLVLCLDPDDAGRRGQRMIQNASRNKIIYSVSYKDGRDINDLSWEEVEELLKTKHLGL